MQPITVIPAVFHIKASFSLASTTCRSASALAVAARSRWWFRIDDAPSLRTAARS
jgi:hypothetical protein